MSMNTTRDKIPNLRVGEGQGQTADDCSPATETWPSAIVVLVCEAMYMVYATVLGKHPLQQSMVQRPGHDRREWLSLRGIGEINDCYSISRTPCCRPPSCSKIDCILCTKWNHSRSQASPSPGSHTKSSTFVLYFAFPSPSCRRIYACNTEQLPSDGCS